MGERRSERADASGQTLRRGLGVLRLLARCHADGVRLSEIGRRQSLPKATTYRHVQALAAEQFVARDCDSNTYRLGPAAFAVGHAAEPSFGIQRQMEAVLHRLAQETGDWICLSIAQGLEAVCISTERGRLPRPPGVVCVGDRYPLGVSSAGLAMLAMLTRAEADEVLRENRAVIERLYPQMSISLIQTLVAQTRDQGYSVVAGKLIPGYWALGVALRDPNTHAPAAITLVAPEARMRNMRLTLLADRMLRASNCVFVSDEHNVHAVVS